jgi:hypothetical protein
MLRMQVSLDRYRSTLKTVYKSLNKPFNFGEKGITISADVAQDGGTGRGDREARLVNGCDNIITYDGA